MISFKQGVQFTQMNSSMLFLLLHMTRAYEMYGYDTVVTSARDGKHMKNSLHYSGKALDFRTYHLRVPEDEATFIINKCKENLGEHAKDFDIIFEKDHIHAEYQPK